MPITAGQVNRLLKMVEALRLDGVLGTVVCHQRFNLTK